MIKPIRHIVLFAALAMVASAAIAQPSYRERSDGYERGARQGREHRAGVFDYYLLSLSWSPTYCAGLRDGRYEPQCDRRGERPYAFVLHGLWPQYERGWPQYCFSPDRGFVPRPVGDRMLDIMPSPKLVFNEYRKHGTCSGLGVDRYFAFARQLYEKVNIPKRFVGLADDRLMISPSELVREFMAANPELRPDMVAVSCGGPGSRLREVRICFDKDGNYRACGRNENQRRLCSAERMYVPPVRAGPDGTEPDRRAPGPQREILPGPRDERRL
jgi:ribonuclease T2